MIAPTVPSGTIVQREPPASVVLDSYPWRRRVVHEATANVELRRITDPVEPVAEQRARPIGCAKSVPRPRVVVLDALALEHAVRGPRAQAVDREPGVERPD